MTHPISTWIDADIGLDVWCHPCGRSGYIGPADARARLDLSHDLDQAAFRVTCSRCGAKGPPAIQIRFTISDYYRRAEERLTG